MTETTVRRITLALMHPAMFEYVSGITGLKHNEPVLDFAEVEISQAMRDRGWIDERHDELKRRGTVWACDTASRMEFLRNIEDKPKDSR